MKVIDAKNKPKLKLNAKSIVPVHARFRHTYNRNLKGDTDEEKEKWKAEREEYDKKAEKKGKGKFLPFEHNEGLEGIKSVFDSYYIAEEAIRKSVNFPAYESRGNLITVFSLPYEVGCDKKNKRTNTVTVITDSHGVVITTHPGLPSG